MRILHAVLALLLAVFVAAPLSAHQAPPPELAGATLEALRNVLPAAKRIEQEEERESALEKIAYGLASLGQTDEALAALPARSRRHNDPQYRRDIVLYHAVGSLLSSGQIEAAREAVKRIHYRGARIGALLAMARYYIENRRVTEARSALYEAAPLVKNLPQPNTIACAAWLLASTGDRTGAQRLFGAAKQAPRSRFSEWYGTIQSIPSFTPDRRALPISYFQAKSGFFDEAIATAGIDQLSATGVLGFLLRAGQLERAQKLMAYSNSGIPLLLEAILALTESGRQNQARALLSPLREVVAAGPETAPPDGTLPFAQLRQREAQVFGALMFAVIDDWSTSDELIRRARADDLEPQFELFYDFTLLNLPAHPQFTARVPTHRKEAAIASILKLAPTQKPHVQVDVYQRLAEAQTGMGRDKEAVESLRHAAETEYRTLKSGDLSIMHLPCIAGHQRDRGDYAGATQSLQWIIEIATEGKWKPPRLASALISGGFFEEAAVLTNAQPDNDVYFVAFLARDLAKERGAEAALKWAKTIRAPQLQAAALQEVVAALFPKTDAEKEMDYVSGRAATPFLGGAAQLGVAGTFWP